MQEESKADRLGGVKREEGEEKGSEVGKARGMAADYKFRMPQTRFETGLKEGGLGKSGVLKKGHH